MNKSTLSKFRKMFEEQKRNLTLADRILRDDLAVSEDDRMDEVDQASTDIEQSMRLRLRNREVLYLKKVQEALQRIEDGVFGECDECGSDIEIRRLEARPTATLCVSCKEEEERREGLTANGREMRAYAGLIPVR